MDLLALGAGGRGPFRSLVHDAAHLAEPPASAGDATGARRATAPAVTGGEADFELLRVHGLHNQRDNFTRRGATFTVHANGDLPGRPAEDLRSNLAPTCLSGKVRLWSLQ